MQALDVGRATSGRARRSSYRPPHCGASPGCRLPVPGQRPWSSTPSLTTVEGREALRWRRLSKAWRDQTRMSAAVPSPTADCAPAGPRDRTVRGARRGPSAGRRRCPSRHPLERASRTDRSEHVHRAEGRHAGVGTLTPADDERGPVGPRQQRVGRAPRVAGSCGPHCTVKLVAAAPVSAPFRVALAPAW
jgi:hypothetical protein